jgi:hypothetical protein
MSRIARFNTAPTNLCSAKFEAIRYLDEFVEMDCENKLKKIGT